MDLREQPISTGDYSNTVEPVLLHDVRREAFDTVKEVYAVRPAILVLIRKFVSSFQCALQDMRLDKMQ